MTEYRIIPVRSEVTREIRQTLRSPEFGHLASVEVATGYGPCRSCLQTFDEGNENRILFTHDPFREIGAHPLPGPIFIHEIECDEYPEDQGFPDDLRDIRLTFDCFDENGQQQSQVMVTDGEIDSTIDALLSKSETEHIIVRNTTEGCYLFRIEKEKSELSKAS